MPVIPWTEIGSFNNIRKYTSSYPEILKSNSKVIYKSKIKLHGTNSAIQIYNNKLIAQSRTTELSIYKDNYGFAKWVESNRDAWLQIEDDSDEEYIIYGEWIGKGIQSNVAASLIDRKSFVVFAAKLLNKEDNLIIEPYLLQHLVKDIPDTYVLPFHTEIQIDWTNTNQDLEKSTSLINQWVLAIEQNDLWIENTFGIKGTGEGLVFYPTSSEHLGAENFKNLCFKAKGEKHQAVKGLPAQVNPTIAENVNKFVEMVLTPARLEQGANLVNSSNNFERLAIGKFLSWIEQDIQKEAKDELTASNLTWKEVQKSLNGFARSWYLKRS